jgi:hypothetical protein
MDDLTPEQTIAAIGQWAEAELDHVRHRTGHTRPGKPRPTPSQRLLARLKAMGVPIEDGALIARTYAGYWQRKQGSWSWLVEQPEHRLPRQMVGSHYPVTDLVRAPRLVATWDRVTGDCSIDPYTEGANFDARYGLTPLVEPDPNQPVESETR